MIRCDRCGRFVSRADDVSRDPKLGKHLPEGVHRDYACQKEVDKIIRECERTTKHGKFMPLEQVIKELGARK